MKILFLILSIGLISFSSIGASHHSSDAKTQVVSGQEESLDFRAYLLGYGDGSVDGENCDFLANYSPPFNATDEELISYDIGYGDGYRSTCNP